MAAEAAMPEGAAVERLGGVAVAPAVAAAAEAVEVDEEDIGSLRRQPAQQPERRAPKRRE